MALGERTRFWRKGQALEERTRPWREGHGPEGEGHGPGEKDTALEGTGMALGEGMALGDGPGRKEVADGASKRGTRQTGIEIRGTAPGIRRGAVLLVDGR